MADNYEFNEDAGVFKLVGLTEREINLWVMGSSKIRNNAHFSRSLTRMWSALFMKELCAHPDHFDELCHCFGFERGAALELSSYLASRCSNLRNFCHVSV